MTKTSELADLAVLVKGLTPAVRDMMASAQKDMAARVEALEQRAPRDGIDGKDADLALVKSLQDDLVAVKAELDLVRKDFSLLLERQSVELAKVIEAIPRPQDGAPGPVGPAGSDGAVGKDGADGKEGQPFTVEQLSAAVTRNDYGLRSAIEMMLHDATVEHLTAHPPASGADGKDGKDGHDGGVGPIGPVGPAGADGSPGTAGERGGTGAKGDNGDPGIPGRDGVGLAGAVIDRDGALVVTLTDGTTKALGAVVGGKGDPGTDGKDGFGFDDLDAVYDEHGRMSLKFSRGDQVKTFRVPGLHVRKFVRGEIFEPGDTVPWSIGSWTAAKTTTIEPDSGEESHKHWRLAVRRGKEGAKGKDGKDGVNGKDGKDGVVPKW